MARGRRTKPTDGVTAPLEFPSSSCGRASPRHECLFDRGSTVVAAGVLLFINLQTLLLDMRFANSAPFSNRATLALSRVTVLSLQQFLLLGQGLRRRATVLFSFAASCFRTLSVSTLV